MPVHYRGFCQRRAKLFQHVALAHVPGFAVPRDGQLVRDAVGSYLACGSVFLAHLVTLWVHSPQVVGFVSVAHPLAWYASLLLGSRRAWKAMVEAAGMPKLLVVGTCDNFTPLSLCDRYVAAAQEAGAQLQVAHVQDADHFLVGHWEEVVVAVQSWVRSNETARLVAEAQPVFDG